MREAVGTMRRPITIKWRLRRAPYERRRAGQILGLRSLSLNLGREITKEKDTGSTQR